MTWHDAPRPETPHGRLLGEAVLVGENVHERNRNVLRHGNTRMSIAQQALQRVSIEQGDTALPNYMLGAELYTIARYFKDSYPLKAGAGDPPPIEINGDEAQITYGVMKSIYKASEGGYLAKLENRAVAEMTHKSPILSDFIDGSLQVFKERDPLARLELLMRGMAGAALMRSVDIQVGRKLARIQFLQRFMFRL